jgi:hypothetical protein
MQKPFIIFGLVGLAVVGLLSLAVPEALGAGIVALVLGMVAVGLMRVYSTDANFAIRVFLIGLGLRLIFGAVVYAMEWREFFGGDAFTYHYRGLTLLDYWMGLISADAPRLLTATSMAGPGWGMTYLVGAIYGIFGENFLAAQTFCAVFGAATVPLVYACAERIFQNRRVARLSAIAVAVFPSFIIWSGQLMKDGLIIFLLVLSIVMVLSLQEKFSYLAVVVLVLALGGIISLRFYIFYMVAVAVAGSFIIGVTNSPGSVLRRSAALVLMGVALTYLGVIRTASMDFERYADLERLQSSRGDLARSAESGFGEDVDVSTTSGAITAIPIGFVYLMLAPFPWTMTSFRQAITLPEVLLWWGLIPFGVWGIWYSVKQRLRAAFPILIFSAMLTLVYSIFQGNVGTAYRQRTQIQVFLFMFIAVGWVLYQERREDRKIMAQSRRRRIVPGLEEDVKGVS